MGGEKRDVQQEYKEILDWLNDVEQRASLMAQQCSGEGEEDEPKKKRKAVSLCWLTRLNPLECVRSIGPAHCVSPTLCHVTSARFSESKVQPE